jgi:predicted lactoylglutathione lyase
MPDELGIAMVGLIVDDIGRAADFYRELGVAVPPSTDGRDRVEIPMKSGVTLFLNTRRFHRHVDPTWTEPVGSSRHVFEFDLGSRAAIEATYARLVARGHPGRRPPFDLRPGVRLALVDDPDGNQVVLSASESRSS